MSWYCLVIWILFFPQDSEIIWVPLFPWQCFLVVLEWLFFSQIVPKLLGTQYYPLKIPQVSCEPGAPIVSYGEKLSAFCRAELIVKYTRTSNYWPKAFQCKENQWWTRKSEQNYGCMWQTQQNHCPTEESRSNRPGMPNQPRLPGQT